MDIKLTPYLSKMPLDGEMINKIKLLTIRNWIYSDFFNINKIIAIWICISPHNGIMIPYHTFLLQQRDLMINQSASYGEQADLNLLTTLLELFLHLTFAPFP